MMSAPLFLTHWNASIPVAVPAIVAKDLKPHQIMGIRFLFDCFQKGHKGAILNHEKGMNCQIQISAFFNALSNSITPKSPALIICSKDSVNAWEYHIEKHARCDSILLSMDNYEEVLQEDSYPVILCPFDMVFVLRMLKDIDFFSIVVDELDLVVRKGIIRKLRSPFNIGITYTNFQKDRNQKILWSMLNWSDYENLGKLNEFCIADDEHLENLRDPYNSCWQRLTWAFCKSFNLPTEKEERELKEAYSKKKHQDILLVPKCKTTRKNRANKRLLRPAGNCMGSRKRTKTTGVLRNKDLKEQTNDDTSLASQNDVPNFTENVNDSQNTIICNADDDDLPILPSVNTTTPKIVKEEPSNSKKSENNDDRAPMNDDDSLTVPNDVQTSTCSQNTIIYDVDDDFPILSSIMSGCNTVVPKSVKEKSSSVFSRSCLCSNRQKERENSNNDDDDDDDDDVIITSIIKNDSNESKTKNLSGSKNSSYKTDILSLLNDDDDDD